MAQLKTVLVTGAAGFIGKNLVEALGRQTVKVLTFGTSDADSALDAHLAEAGVIYHLAGVNRPERVEEYALGNTGFTEQIIARLTALNRRPVIVFSSSIQAELDNPYGLSKRGAEAALAAYAEQTGAPVFIYRLPNVFGKWCRPNYNSVVATYCYDISHGLDITISDPNRSLNLVYIDDVVRCMLSILDGEVTQPGSFCTARYLQVEPTYSITLGRLASLIFEFRDIRTTLRVPDLDDRLVRCLYATYLSY